MSNRLSFFLRNRGFNFSQEDFDTFITLVFLLIFVYRDFFTFRVFLRLKDDSDLMRGNQKSDSQNLPVHLDLSIDYIYMKKEKRFIFINLRSPTDLVKREREKKTTPFSRDLVESGSLKTRISHSYRR